MVDRVQTRFLEELSISPETALLEFKLAPLCARRDMAMLGLIHRVVLGEAPAQFEKFIRRATHQVFPRDARGSELRHEKQLWDPIDGTETAMMRRSLFGRIYTYNLLPAIVVNANSVKRFQRQLQNGLRINCRSGGAWSCLFRQ